jgi:hypothetical protein
VNDVAATFPKETPVAPERSLPKIVTEVPPAVGPELSLRLVTTGAGAWNVNWSDDDTADVPLGVVTVTSTCPAAWAGATATIEPEPLTVNDVAATFPKETAVAPERLLPEIVTEVPPAVGPVIALRLLTVGAGARYMNWSAALVAETPPAVVTITSTAPAACAGAITEIDVAEITVNGTAVAPNETPVVPLRSVPVIVTTVPPPVEPFVGLRPVTVGAGTWYVNWSAGLAADGPPGVVTVTSTPPAACAGVTAEMDVEEITVTEVAAIPPNETAVAPVKLVPLIVTLVPPLVEPLLGLRLETVGAGT